MTALSTAPLCGRISNLMQILFLRGSVSCSMHLIVGQKIGSWNNNVYSSIEEILQDASKNEEKHRLALSGR